jgi:hypothetical protein
LQDLRGRLRRGDGQRHPVQRLELRPQPALRLVAWHEPGVLPGQGVVLACNDPKDGPGKREDADCEEKTARGIDGHDRPNPQERQPREVEHGQAREGHRAAQEA